MIETAGFTHEIYRQAGASGPLVIFLEGDGLPWGRAGRQPAADPTPNRALAFELMRRTPAKAAYLTRPCYFGLAGAACEPTIWTHERFSPAVVDSLVEVIEKSIDGDAPLALVGHSGGGALAMLLAARLENVQLVVTVAGLIDTAAWTDHHRYEPLNGSLNPRDAELDTDIIQVHLIGERDTNVLPEHTRRAVGSQPNVHVWGFDDYDHSCCFARTWPATWARIVALLEPL
ncbi:MAG: thioesterase domain-containing protein [Gammaproteobacteria bacterium]